MSTEICIGPPSVAGGMMPNGVATCRKGSPSQSIAVKSSGRPGEWAKAARSIDARPQPDLMKGRDGSIRENRASVVGSQHIQTSRVSVFWISMKRSPAPPRTEPAAGPSFFTAASNVASSVVLIVVLVFLLHALNDVARCAMAAINATRRPIHARGPEQVASKGCSSPRAHKALRSTSPGLRDDILAHIMPISKSIRRAEAPHDDRADPSLHLPRLRGLLLLGEGASRAPIQAHLVRGDPPGLRSDPGAHGAYLRPDAAHPR